VKIWKSKFQAMVKNEANESNHGRARSRNDFKQSLHSTLKEHYYKNIFVDLIRAVSPLVLGDAL
jgi:hypothetical protein